jgi:hypothetical protein
MVADLVRLSRVTWLYAERGADKSGFLGGLVVPRLKAMSGREVCVFFDEWNEAPLAGIMAQLKARVAGLRPPPPPSDDPASLSIADTIKAWQQALDVSFTFVFDRFEDYLATSDRSEAKDFEAEFLRLVNADDLRVHLLVALDEDAVPLLGSLQASTSSFGAGSIRLAREPHSHAPEAEPRHAHSLVGSQPGLRFPSSVVAGASALPDEDRRFTIGSKSSAAKLVGTPASAEIVDESVVIAPADAASSAGAHDRLTDTDLARSSHAPLRKDTPQRGVFRMPLGARIALSVLLLSLSSLLLLRVWQPTAPSPQAPRIVETPFFPKAPAATPNEPEAAEAAADLTPNSPSQRDVVASVADQPRRESPRVREGPAQYGTSGGPIQLGTDSESVRGLWFTCMCGTTRSARGLSGSSRLWHTAG